MRPRRVLQRSCESGGHAPADVLSAPQVYPRSDHGRVVGVAGHELCGVRCCPCLRHRLEHGLHGFVRVFRTHRLPPQSAALTYSSRHPAGFGQHEPSESGSSRDEWWRARSGRTRRKERRAMASKESLRVDRYWATVRQSTMNPQPDDLVTNDQWDLLTGEPRGVDYLEVDAAGVPALWAVPHGTAEDSPVLLCFHGGGYVGGSMFTHRKMFSHLAKAIGCRALVIDYTLVFQGGGFPPPGLVGLTAFPWVLAQGNPAPA